MDNLYKEVSVKKIAKVVDGLTFDNGYVSIMPEQSETQIALVVGAKWENRYAPYFSKEGLGKLIEQLQFVHTLMKD